MSELALIRVSMSAGALIGLCLLCTVFGFLCGIRGAIGHMEKKTDKWRNLHK